MDRSTLDDAPMGALREVGYTLEDEPDIDSEVRGREKSELIDEILAAAEVVGDDRAREILASHNIATKGDNADETSDFPEFDKTIVRVAANTTQPGLSINDILVDPAESLLEGLPHQRLDGPAEAYEQIESTNGCRLNDDYSRAELPDPSDDGGAG